MVVFSANQAPAQSAASRGALQGASQSARGTNAAGASIEPLQRGASRLNNVSTAYGFQTFVSRSERSPAQKYSCQMKDGDLPVAILVQFCAEGHEILALKDG
ncbi:hypothetical protein MRX96_055295 [Rhipicephalus microplus]